MTTESNFGDLDGEAIDALALRITGAGGLTELVDEGDELTLIATVTVGANVKIKRDDAGRLLREHGAKIIRLAVAPEGSTVADDATSFLAGYQAALDALNGIDRLPLDDDHELVDDDQAEDDDA